MLSLKDSLMLEGGGVISLVGAGGKTTLMFKIAAQLVKAGHTVLTTTTTRLRTPSPDSGSHLILCSEPEGILRESEKYLYRKRHVTAASGFVDQHRKKIKGLDTDVIDDLRDTGLFRWILVEADGAAQKPLKVPASHEPVIPTSSQWVVGVVGLDAVGRRLDEEWVFRSEQFAKLTGVHIGRPVNAESVVKAVVHPQGILKGAPEHADLFVFLNKADNDEKLEMGRTISRGILQKDHRFRFKRVIIGKTLQEHPVIEYHEHNQ
jgi:probable selenium-dependent hydroxylase accessory protein YqeC